MTKIHTQERIGNQGITTYQNGDICYYLLLPGSQFNYAYHRVDGPAIIYAYSGNAVRYYLFGKLYCSKGNFDRATKHFKKVELGNQNK